MSGAALAAGESQKTPAASADPLTKGRCLARLLPTKVMNEMGVLSDWAFSMMNG